MAHSATELDTATLFGARRVTYRSWSSGSMPRSMSRTGISASCARLRDSSQPEPSVADSRIRSTPSATNEANASIWDFWSRFVVGGGRDPPREARGLGEGVLDVLRVGLAPGALGADGDETDGHGIVGASAGAAGRAGGQGGGDESGCAEAEDGTTVGSHGSPP